MLSGSFFIVFRLDTSASPSRLNEVAESSGSTQWSRLGDDKQSTRRSQRVDSEKPTSRLGKMASVTMALLSPNHAGYDPKVPYFYPLTPILTLPKYGSYKYYIVRIQFAPTIIRLHIRTAYRIHPHLLPT